MFERRNVRAISYDHASGRLSLPGESMRSFRWALGLQKLLVGIILVHSAMFADATRCKTPNIVLLTVDDMGIADIGYNADLSVRGPVTTPVLDSLAEEGTVLTHFYTNTICTPTRATLLTGRFASRMNMKLPIGLESTAHALNLDEKLLPEVMKELGYQTHMVGKWHLGHHERKYTPIARGFDSYCGNVQGAVDHFYHNFSPPIDTGPYRPHDQHCEWRVDDDDCDPGHWGGRHPSHRKRHRCRCGESPDYKSTCDLASGGYFDDDPAAVYRYEMDFEQPADATTTPDASTYGEFYVTNIHGSMAVDVVEEHNPSRGPLFLFASFFAPHSPLQALDIDFEGCDTELITEPDRLVFCAVTKALDRNVGYLVDALKDKGMWEDTVFIFASDNGGSPAFGGDNGNLRSGKGFYYEGGLLAPAFVRFGERTVSDVSATQGITNDQRIQVADLFPTIISAAAQGRKRPELPNEIDGRDLWRYLSAGKPLPDSMNTINFNLAAGPGFISLYTLSTLNADGSYIEAVIATYDNVDYKLCRNCAGERGDEVFDLTADPLETTNLVGDPEYDDVFAFLEDVLAAWVDVSFPELEYLTLVERTAELLEEAGLDSSLADELVNVRRCTLPLDSPEFLCADCSSLAQDFPLTTPPEM